MKLLQVGFVSYREDGRGMKLDTENYRTRGMNLVLSLVAIFGTFSMVMWFFEPRGLEAIFYVFFIMPNLSILLISVAIYFIRIKRNSGKILAIGVRVFTIFFIMLTSFFSLSLFAHFRGFLILSLLIILFTCFLTLKENRYTKLAVIIFFIVSILTFSIILVLTP